MNMNTYFLRDAFKSNELYYSMQNISTDDGKEIKDYTPQEIIAEARYVLSCFYESGHSFNEWLNSDNEEERQGALKEVKALKSFIKSHEVTL